MDNTEYCAKWKYIYFQWYDSTVILQPDGMENYCFVIIIKIKRQSRLGDSRNIKGINGLCLHKPLYAGINGQNPASPKKGLQDFMPRHKLHGIREYRIPSKKYRNIPVHAVVFTNRFEYQNPTTKTATKKTTTIVVVVSLYFLRIL